VKRFFFRSTDRKKGHFGENLRPERGHQAILITTVFVSMARSHLPEKLYSGERRVPSGEKLQKTKKRLLREGPSRLPETSGNNPEERVFWGGFFPAE
jgi:hypothetical protein